MVEQVDGIAVGLRGRGGYGGVLGGARAVSALYGQSGALPRILGGGLDMSELWAVPEPSARHPSHLVEQPMTGWTHRGSTGPSWRRRHR